MACQVHGMLVIAQSLTPVSRLRFSLVSRGPPACSNISSRASGESVLGTSVLIQQSTAHSVALSRRRVCCQAADASKKSGGVGTTTAIPVTAKEAVDTGLVLFKKGRVRDALALFDAAMEKTPTTEEAQAALYNKACCHAAREEGDQAADALRLALKDYNLRFSVILGDPDMAAFRAMPQFRQLREEARLGGESVGSSLRSDLKLISEVQAPFRPVRKFLYVALTAAAGIATVFTIPRIGPALAGGEGAPQLQEVLTNLAINVVGAAVLVALFIWDSKQEEALLTRVQRDETLSRLPVRLQSGRVVELASLRQNTRPVILVGSRATVERAVAKAERMRSEFQSRGLFLVPLAWGGAGEEAAAGAAKKRGFGASKAAPAAAAEGSSGEDDFDAKLAAAAAKGVGEVERRFRGEPVSPGEWESWVREQQEAMGLKPGEDGYIVLRLDGRPRSSGKGMPDWQKVLDEVPLLDGVLSKLEM